MTEPFQLHYDAVVMDMTCPLARDARVRLDMISCRRRTKRRLTRPPLIWCKGLTVKISVKGFTSSIFSLCLLAEWLIEV